MFQKDIKLVIKNGAKCAVIGEEKPSVMGAWKSGGSKSKKLPVLSGGANGA